MKKIQSEMRDLVRIYNISIHIGKLFDVKSDNERENEEISGWK